MTDVITKGLIYKDDLALADGYHFTGTRKTSTGGSQTLNKFDWVGVDVHALYGARTSAAITAAISEAGTGNFRLFLSPGAWTLSANLAIPTNAHLVIMDGATLDGAFTLTINGRITGAYGGIGADVTMAFGAAAAGSYFDADGNYSMTGVDALEVLGAPVSANDVLRLGDFTSSAVLAEIVALGAALGVTVPRTKIIEIGDWDMTASSTKSVPHGLTFDKIIGLRVLLRTDTDGRIAQDPAGITQLSATGSNVIIAREAAWNSSQFDSTSYNRGWVIVDYID